MFLFLGSERSQNYERTGRKYQIEKTNKNKNKIPVVRDGSVGEEVRMDG
jgi:hypothetical protein